MRDKIIRRLNEAASGESKRIINAETGKMKLVKSTVLSDDITPHIFRHTYAASLYKAGIDVKSAQYLLGHTSVQMTLEIYTHLAEENNITLQNKLDEFFSRPILSQSANEQSVNNQSDHISKVEKA